MTGYVFAGLGVLDVLLRHEPLQRRSGEAAVGGGATVRCVGRSGQRYGRIA